jgi:signal transduction histidine kinase
VSSVKSVISLSPTDLFGAQILVKGLEAVYLVAHDVPSNLVGDPMRLRQILVNLIGIAIKFTAQGEITINVECKGKAEKVHDLPTLKKSQQCP